MTTATQSEFSRLMGWDKAHTSRLKATGRLVMVGEGRAAKVDIAASIERIESSMGGRGDLVARYAAKRGAATPQAVEAKKTPENAAKTEPATQSTENADTAISRIEPRAERLHYENQLIKLEMALRRGEQFELDAVQREVNSLGGMLRAGIERVIDQTAPRLAASREAAQRKQIVQAEINRLHHALRRELPRVMRRIHASSRLAVANKLGESE